MAVKICPIDKNAFDFQEGQYLYLNCPHISEKEWHPFTISSARGDLSIPGSGVYNPLRVCTETGEEVTEVPRPATLDKKVKWSKFCPVSKDWRRLEQWEMLDKHETTYHDFISCHIKVPAVMPASYAAPPERRRGAALALLPQWAFFSHSSPSLFVRCTGWTTRSPRRGRASSRSTSSL